MIPGYDKGANVLLLNTQYVRPHKTETGRWTSGTLYLTYRDLDTFEKKIAEIPNPTVTTYITKPHLRNTFKTQRAYMKKEDVDEYVVPYKDIAKFIRDKIAEDGVDKTYVNIYDEAVREKQSRAKKEVFKWRHAYRSDMDIEDYAVTRCFLDYEPKDYYITKSYLDIECDIYNMPNAALAIDTGSAKVNAISYIVDHEPDGKPAKVPYVFEFLLRDHNRYTQQEDFENRMDEFVEQCHSEFDSVHGKCKYKIMMFDDEVQMLKQLFGLIHITKSDFIHIYNMSFDIRYLIKRLEFLGYNPMDFFCHPDFSDAYMQFNLDAFNKNDFKNRTDSFDCTFYSRVIDQMLNYAGVRKSSREYGGNGLDNVAKIELGAEKRVYKDPRVDVINAAVKSYWEFVLYSINDSLLLMSLERKVEDTTALFEQAYTGGTRTTKVLKQSVYIKNVYTIDYDNMGLVMDNNKNIDYTNSGALCEYDNIELIGALVANPWLNAENGVEIFGRPSRFMYQILIDFDAESMYPNVKIKWGIAKERQYGRLIIPKPVLKNENPINDAKYMRGGNFVSDLVTRDMFKIGAWFNMKPLVDYAEEFRNRDTTESTDDKLITIPTGKDAFGRNVN